MVLQRAEQRWVDGFLSYWFALDALAMPGRRGVKILENRLARIYERDPADVKSRFRIGQLRGVRDDIVHEALRPTIHFRALDFASALYWDALMDTLDLEPPRAAGQVLAAQDIEEWFPKLGRPTL